MRTSLDILASVIKLAAKFHVKIFYIIDTLVYFAPGATECIHITSHISCIYIYISYMHNKQTTTTTQTKTMCARIYMHGQSLLCLTHWGRVMHICVWKLTTINSDNGLSPARRQAIIWTNAGILLLILGANFSEIFSEIHRILIHENAFENVVYEMAAILSRPPCVKVFLRLGVSGRDKRRTIDFNFLFVFVFQNRKKNYH